VLFQATNKLVFTVSSPTTTIKTNSVHLTLNGVDVSTNLVFAGGPSTWNVTFPGLLLNNSYTVLISVTDAGGSSATSSLKIDTYNPVLQVEAEDFDFDPNQSPVPNSTGNRYIDNPVPSTSAAANSYFGQVGDELIDEDGNNNATALTSLAGYNTDNYRINDRVMTSPVTDGKRAQFVATGAGDFNLGFLGAGFWENYTRTWPAGTYNIYGRVASGNGGTIHIRWDQIETGWGTTGQVVTNVGTISLPGTGGYASYFYAPLMDKFGNYANVTLNGTNTFRTTEDNPVNINFYMVLAARTDLPRIDNVTPDGTTLLQGGTSALSFIASSPNGVAKTNVLVTLNGTNISTNLVFTGSSNTWNVSYPALVPNTSYTAAITITDAVHLATSTTVTFDTFNPNNFTWEAEDFDFTSNGLAGQYIDNPAPSSPNNPIPNGYADQVSTPGIDENYVAYRGTHLYRPADFISTEVTSDAARVKFLSAELANSDPTIQDYDIDFWTNTAFINYTHTYPAGNFNVYARLSAGNGAFTLPLAQVTGGWGTPTQTTQTLGVFKGTGTSFTTWQYVPLVDATSGKLVTLSLGGTNTFQLTADGNENANFYMLVLAGVPLTGTVSGGSITLSFPTLTGFNYSVQFKNNLADAHWTTLIVVPGDGTTKTVNDSVSGIHFYRLSVQ
jgi:hypothetical protein